jgi:hypothetical protein
MKKFVHNNLRNLLSSFLTNVWLVYFKIENLLFPCYPKRFKYILLQDNGPRIEFYIQFWIRMYSIQFVPKSVLRNKTGLDLDFTLKNANP